MTHTHTHTHNGISLSCMKTKIFPFGTTWVDLEGIMLSEVSQTERQIPHDFTYVRNLTNKINEQTNQRQTHRYRERNDGR